MNEEKISTHAIDTNILIYAFDAHDNNKHEIAKKIIQEAFNGKRKLVVTNQILAEFTYVASTKLSPALTPEEISRVIQGIQSNYFWTILDYSTKDIIKANGMKKHFWDSLIATTINEKNIVLLTENTKHFEHTAIKTENPFA